jgi:hypothetical protein
MDKIHVAQHRGKWQALVNTAMELQVSHNVRKYD